jgi:diacylglycerol kinase family enzyme
MQPLRAALLLNLRAGSLLGQPDLPARIEAILRAGGLEVMVVPEDATLDLGARLDLALEGREVDAVVVGGGDGTIAVAAQRLAGRGIALGILPLGTMNQLARDLGIPLDLEEAAASLARGELRAIDVAEVNGQVFLCNSVLGLPTHLSRHRERHRGRTSLRTQFLFALATMRGAWRHRPMRLAVDLGDGPRRVWTRALAISNNAYDEGFGLMMRRSRLDAGVLTLYVARRFGIWWALRMLASMWLGAWRNSALLDRRSTTSVEIRSRRQHLRVMNDGEVSLFSPPLRYAIRPGALRVIVPRPATHEPPHTAPPEAVPPPALPAGGGGDDGAAAAR